MDEIKKFTVTIDNTKINLISEDTEEYLTKVADYVNDNLSKIEHSVNGSKVHNLKYIMLTVDVVDKYFKEAEQIQIQKQQFEEVVKNAGKENKLLEEQRNKYKNEFEENKKQLLSVKSKLEQYEKDNKMLREQNEKQKSEITNLTNGKKTQDIIIKNNEQKMYELKKEIEKSTNENNKIKLELVEAKKDVENQLQEIQSLYEEIEETKQDADKKEALISNEIEQIQTLRKKSEDIQSKLEVTEDKYYKVKKEKEDAEYTVMQLEETINSVMSSKNKEIEQLKEEINLLSEMQYEEYANRQKN